MINVIKSLLFRLKKSRLFWAFFGVCGGLPLLSALLQWLVLDIAESLSGMPLGSLGLETLTYVTLGGVASISSDVGLFTLICTSIFLCKEFTDGTIRNSILSNKSKSSVYFAYLIVGSIVGLTYLLVYYVVTLLALGIPFGFGATNTVGEIISSCLCSLVLGIFATLFVVCCVTMFLFATGKQSTSIVLPLLVTILLPGVIASIVEVVTMLVSFTQELSVEAYSWIPLYNVSLYDASNVDGGLVAKILMYYAIFIGLFIYLGHLSATKKDLK